MATLPVFAGCQGSHEPAPAVSIRHEGTGSTAIQRADWDDIEAAAIVGSAAIEAVIHSSRRESDTRGVFELRLIDGQPGQLIFERAAASTDPLHPAPEDLTLHASIGRFSDGALEAKLLRATVRRLEQLRGVDYAPLD